MVEIKLNNVTAAWFIDEEGRDVFSGAAYGLKSVAVFGIPTLSRFQFLVTANPRFRLWKHRKATNQNWIVYETLWVNEAAAEQVLGHVDDMFHRAKPDWAEPWHIMDRRYILPTLRFCAKKAGVTGMRQVDFVRWVKTQETEKLQKKLVKGGINEEIASKYTIV